MRIAQEIMLGIGGVRALRALGLDPTVWHMNEGHSAFLGLERCRELVAGLDVTSRSRARSPPPTPSSPPIHPSPPATTSSTSSWSTPTSPTSGRSSGSTATRSTSSPAQDTGWGAGFSMTVLALRLSAQHNGVSKLHGEVSRAMWQFLWPENEVDEVPIGSITNGVHTATWLAPRLDALFRRALGADWYAHLDDPALWTRLDEIPDGELWEAHRRTQGGDRQAEPGEDTLHRDFTINGLFYDIATYTVLDFVGGVEDLERRVVRTIGDPLIRFREDPVRMLAPANSRHASRSRCPRTSARCHRRVRARGHEERRAARDGGAARPAAAGLGPRRVYAYVEAGLLDALLPELGEMGPRARRRQELHAAARDRHQGVPRGEA